MRKFIKEWLIIHQIIFYISAVINIYLTETYKFNSNNIYITLIGLITCFICIFFRFIFILSINT